MADTSIPDPSPAFSFPLPTVLTYPASTPPQLVTQGAEGRLYKTTYLVPDLPCALKHRPSKPYRHPVLDARLTRARILAEARVLARCRRDGVPVPAIYAVDEVAGWLMMEWVDGVPVRQGVNEWLGERPKDASGADEARGSAAAATAATAASDDQAPLVNLMRRIGSAVGMLHRTGVVHGDLTTSNMMLRPRKKSAVNGHHVVGNADVAADRAKLLEGDIVLIDFGLAAQGTSEEDRAVDLYVLERAFGSTHPRAEDLFSEVLQGYKDTFKDAGPVLRRLEEVRQRGRKRSMIG